MTDPFGNLNERIGIKLLGATCVLVLVVILVAGLWPFNPFPSNQVSWLSNQNGVRFGGRGIVISKKVFMTMVRPADAPSSLEIWMKPIKTMTASSRTLLTIYNLERHHQFRLAQYKDDLLLRQTASDDPLRNRTTIVAQHVFK